MGMSLLRDTAIDLLHHVGCRASVDRLLAHAGCPATALALVRGRLPTRA